MVYIQHAFFFKMSSDTKCKICKRPSSFKCGNCLRVSYCSKDHQKEDWKNHKESCISYKVVSDDKMGRHLIAIRTISEGEIIIKESPIVSGPAQVTPPVCLGCYNLLTELSLKDCSKCGWPVCSEQCEKSESHQAECEITSQYKNSKVKIKLLSKDLPHPSYQCLTVLRCLHLKKSRPKKWEKLMMLESHCEERKSTEKYKSDQRFIAEFIPKFFNYQEFSSEEILKVAGIVQINAHEVPLRDPGYIAVYEKASFLEHNCRANCMKSFTNSGELVIRAAGKISPGEHLSICYTDALWGREIRLNHLLESKFFLCQCARCSDPTEFETHFNSFKCLNSKCNGYLVPVLPKKPQDIKPDCWKCIKCNNTFQSETIEKLKSELYDTISSLNKKDAKSCTKFLQKYDKTLHSNHYLMVDICIALIDLYGWQEPLLSLKNKELEWTLTKCKEVYDLVTKLVPAENRLRGVLLYQLQFVLGEYGRRKAAKLEIDAVQIRENLLERKNVLTNAYNLLRYEPDQMPEGIMAVQAKQALKNLEEYLSTSKP